MTWQSKTAIIGNSRGLHARAAAKLVKLADKFDAKIKVSRDNQVVSGHSIMGLMTLAASKGSKVIVKANGSEANQALNAIYKLITDNFHED